MALLQNKEVKGFNLSGVYIKVEKFIGTKDTLIINISMKSGKDAPHFDLVDYGCPYNLEGDNPIKQAYAYLKTLPEFEGASDV
jgi:hypothetical protein